MKTVLLLLALAVAATGCTTKANSRANAQGAFFAGQNAAFQQAAAGGVTVIGPVQNPRVPWVAGLTLAQAIATANYQSPNDPKLVTITRRGESATLDAEDLLNGAPVPLEPGDVVEIR